MTQVRDSDATRVALAMIRADWQGDDESWSQLWSVVDDPAEVVRSLTTLCRENLEQLASVAGISTGEMLHRMAQRVIPHPDIGQLSVIALPESPVGH
ncbi:MAG: hypothetical protein ACRDV2_12990 [Actinomycetes bacterium]